MAVPPPASWIDAPKKVYATDGRVSLRWWCGGSQDVVTGCKLTVDTNGATTFTTDVTTQSSTYEWRYDASTATLGMDTPGTYKISVYGYNGEGNGDAAFATVQVYVAPAVSILSPADSEVVTGLPFTASWTASDTAGIAEQVLYLYDSLLTTLYLQRSLDGSARSFTFDVNDGMLANDSGYTLIVGATSGVGLYGSDAARFTTAWMPPAQPTATVTNDTEAMTAIVTATAGEATSATNIGEYFAHSLTDTSYWYSTNFSAAMTALTDGWARFTYTNSTSDWAWVNVSPKASAVALTPSTAYTYLIEVRNLSGAIRVNAPATHSTASVWTGSRNSDFSTDGVAHVPATTLADMGSATMVRTYLAVPANSTVTCDIRLSLYAGEYDGPYVPYDPPATDHLIVARVNADGTRWVIADNVESGESVTDPLPPLGVPYTYEITAVSRTGATSVGAVDMTITTGYWAFNFGARATEHAKLRFNAKTAMSTTHGGDSYHFADGGQGSGLPVYYATTDRDISGSGSWDTVGQQEADRINALTLRYPVGWMRDPYGHRYRAHMRWSIDHGLPASRVWAISLDWDAVRFTEAW